MNSRRLLAFALVIHAVTSFVSRIISERSASRALAMVATDSAVIESREALKIIRVEPPPSPEVRFTQTSTMVKPPALFLPGIDGQGTYAFSSLRNLSLEYDLYRLEVQPEDRSTFVQVADTVVSAIRKMGAPVVLIGDSFGGLLACFIASQHKALVSTLVLVNPATSYELTAWPLLAPLILNSGPAYPVLGLSSLFVTVVQPEQFQRIGSRIVNRMNSFQTNQERIDELNRLFKLSQDFLSIMNSETVAWRLTRWLQNGNLLMKSRYNKISTPTLLLIGAGDRLLPSADEGYRLQSLLQTANVEIKEFRRGGHAILDDAADLAAILRKTKTLGPPRVPVPLDVPFPSEADIANAENSFVNPLRRSFSPIFLSKDVNGNLNLGIDNVPVGHNGRPVLLVGNHQLYGLDTGLLVHEFLVTRRVLVRGLAHPVLFGALNGLADDNASNESRGMFSTSNVQKFGAVEVSPGSIYELLRRNETILLFPGGANEACHGREEAYILKWSNRTDFVRMAAAFDAIIVPFGAIGVADSLDILLDSSDIYSNPILNRLARRAATRIPRARATVAENFTLPIFSPKLPRRIYFLFQQPFDTRNLDARDKKACRDVYLAIRDQVEESLATLLRFRQNDPYDSFLSRAPYELSSGEQAPTASLLSKV